MKGIDDYSKRTLHGLRAEFLNQKQESLPFSATVEERKLGLYNSGYIGEAIRLPSDEFFTDNAILSYVRLYSKKAKVRAFLKRVAPTDTKKGGFIMALHRWDTLLLLWHRIAPDERLSVEVEAICPSEAGHWQGDKKFLAFMRAGGGMSSDENCCSDETP